MIKDLKEQSKDQRVIKTEVCIVGAGAAGISMALSFHQMGINVVLLEGGGLEQPDSEERDLYDAKIGEKFYPIGASRLRYFGGSTNHWGGWSRALDSFDFSEKKYFAEKGWPISKEAVYQYYPKAAELCEIPNFERCHNGYYETQLTEGLINWGDSVFMNKFFVFSPPTRFGSKYLSVIRNSQYIDAYLHANATKLIFNGTNIEGVLAQSLTGQQLRVEAKHTILAMGGLENPRFMLNNVGEHFEDGIGNHADWLGRCFMDHSGFRPIDLLLPEGLKYKKHKFQTEPVMPVLSMNEDSLLKHQLNNFCVMFKRQKDNKVINSNYKQNPWFDNPPQTAGNYSAQFIFEPSPCKNSRVTLIDDVDALGMKKLKLDWQFNQRDFRSVEKVVELMIKEFGVMNIGRVKWKRLFEPKTISEIGGGMHHAGTTKMSSLPEDGVIDENCRVHESTGLYVMGNSVFPHVGFSNPTVTIVALSLRLADHIKKRLS